LEYDTSRAALIEPHRLLSPIDIPQHCVICFFKEVIAGVCGEDKAVTAFMLSSEMGRNPVYIVERDGARFAVAHPGVGAPLAAGFLEELIALGCRNFIACGGSGVLNADITVGHVVVP